jgi:hypothetical protein
MSATVSSAVAATCCSSTTGAAVVHDGTSLEAIAPVRRASSLARSWISASL